jgi:tetratricopeptide (TPR) repeat protein
MPMLNERASSGDPRDTVYIAMKTMVNAIFVQSDAVDCRRLDNIFKKQVEAKKNNSSFLENILMLYKNLDCEESAVYFDAAGYQYKIAPTPASATGMALLSYQKKDFFRTISYFQEAISLEKNKEEKSKLQMRIAAIYNELGDYSRARAESRTALSYNPSNASAYIMIAYLYVNYATLVNKNPIVQKTAYWAAVDKLEMAKKIDPGCSDIVNRLINSYKSNYPSDRELFINDIIGDTYVVPGWIQEKTTIR